MYTNINNNGVVASNIFSNYAPVGDMKIKTMLDNSVWARIFYHNCKNDTVLFSNLNEVLNTQTTDKYSRLYLLDNFRAFDNKFEFLLCYPNDSNDYNRWKQTNNPCNEFKDHGDGSAVADGYEDIHIPWTSNYWGGLTRGNSDHSIYPTYINGSVGHNNWFWAIGASTKYEKGIPSGSSIGGSTASVVELWVRIDTVFIKKFQLYKECVVGNDFIEQ